jgi:hypothetical protein
LQYHTGGFDRVAHENSDGEALAVRSTKFVKPILK